jgi:PAS domain S-box-containing protein
LVKRPATAHAIAIAALVAAVLLRWLLDPVMGDSLPLVTLFGAVTIAVWVGGYQPALIVAVLGYLACAYLFIERRGAIGLGDFRNVVGLSAYVLTCGLIIGIGEAMRLARKRAGEQGEVLRVMLGSIGDAVITTDIRSRVTHLNAVAASLTGWTENEALGQPLDAVFRIVDEQSRLPLEHPATRGMREDVGVEPAKGAILLAKDGAEHVIDESAAPLKDTLGRNSGCVLIFRDISLRRRFERDEANRLLDTRLLASIVESSDDAIVSKSLDGIIRSWNTGAERVFGYPAHEAVGRHISLVIPPDRMDEEDRIIASLKVGRRVEHFETERVRRDGRTILVSLTISPVKDASGTVVGASKIARDITRQRLSEERERGLLAEAAAANAKFRAFFDQGAALAGIMNLDGTIIEPNRLLWEGCGYARERVIGVPFWDGPWWAPSSLLVERVKTGTAAAAAGRSFRAELPYYVADGSERIADVIILPIKDDAGRVLFLAFTATDITDRKRAEAELEKFATLVENSTDFIGICDVQGVPFYVNPAGLRMVGLDGMEQARRTHVREFFFPDDQARITEDFFPTVVEKGHGEIDVRFRHFKTGEALWMSYKVLTLTDAAGLIVAFATVSQDVTERNRLEENLRRLATDLSEVDRRKDEFLATLSHELRNPLTPLRNTLEILKRGGGEMPLPRIVDTMERQLAHLVRLVDDLLDLNRINHDRIDLRKDEVDLALVIHHAVEAARPLAEASGHELRVSVPSEPIHVLGDATRLTQVVGNVLNNSCKYTRPGGKISLSAERCRDEAVITVRDSGIGIPRDKLRGIFEMFTQVDRSPERAQGGLGIGLALVQRLIQMHGGSVEARSAGEGQGSEFVIRLPNVIEIHSRVATPSVARPPNRPCRILIVDDNVDAASTFATLLRITGHETFMAHDGENALDAAEQHRPDVVLLDIGLPKLNGYEVARRIREQSWARGMVLVALTGWGQADDRRRSREAGFDHHLVKPVDHAALLALLDSLGPEKRAPDA